MHLGRATGRAVGGVSQPRASRSRGLSPAAATATSSAVPSPPRRTAITTASPTSAGSSSRRGSPPRSGGGLAAPGTQRRAGVPRRLVAVLRRSSPHVHSPRAVVLDVPHRHRPGRARLFAICSSLVPIPTSVSANDRYEDDLEGVREVQEPGSIRRSGQGGAAAAKAAARPVTSGDASRDAPPVVVAPAAAPSDPAPAAIAPGAGASRRDASRSPSAGRRRPCGSRRRGRNRPGVPRRSGGTSRASSGGIGTAAVPRFRGRRRAGEGAERQDRSACSHRPTIMASCW